MPQKVLFGPMRHVNFFLIFWFLARYGYSCIKVVKQKKLGLLLKKKVSKRTISWVCLLIRVPSGTRMYIQIIDTILQVSIIPSTRPHAPVRFRQESNEGSHSSHASPLPPRPKVKNLLTTCQTSSPVEIWHMRVHILGTKGAIFVPKCPIFCHHKGVRMWQCFSRGQKVPRFITYVSWLQLTYVMNQGTFCPLEKHWHILTPIDAVAKFTKRWFFGPIFKAGGWGTMSKKICEILIFKPAMDSCIKVENKKKWVYYWKKRVSKRTISLCNFVPKNVPFSVII
jgi:hypothetical protein